MRLGERGCAVWVMTKLKYLMMMRMMNRMILHGISRVQITVMPTDLATKYKYHPYSSLIHISFTPGFALAPNNSRKAPTNNFELLSFNNANPPLAPLGFSKQIPATSARQRN
jgi:hypothetical protein